MLVEFIYVSTLGKLNQNTLETRARWNFVEPVNIHTAFCRRHKDLGSMFPHPAGIFPLDQSLLLGVWGEQAQAHSSGEIEPIC